MHPLSRQGEILMTELYAVLTGDLVKSSKLGPLELDAVRKTLFEAADEMRTWQAGLIVGSPEFFRGDAWQLLMSDPGMFLRVALYLRAALRRQKGWDTRISIGLGGVQQIDERQISLSIGSSFTLSGHGLDDMGSAPGFRFHAEEQLAPRTGWVQPLLDLCGALVGRLKPGQSATICEVLRPDTPTQREIATRLGISQQGVSDALLSAGWSAIDTTLDYVESLKWGAP
jgi:hypothetical protein